MIIYGRNVAEEILKFNKKSVKKIYLQNDFSDKKIISLLQNEKLPLISKSKKDMDTLANGNHQGIILDVMDYQYYSLDDVLKNNINFVLILDHLEDPHNFGAIIRTAEAAGVDAIIVPQDRETLVNATVMKTSAGSLVRSKIVKVSNLVNAINKLKDNGFWIVGTALEGDDYREIDYSGKIGLVVGNEGKGMSPIITKACDFVATIPMYGEINSLNASVATGIMIYEVVRNRK